MRYVIAVLLVALTALSGYSAFVRTDESTRQAMQGAASSISTEFTIPANQQLADPRLAQQILTDAAGSTHVNVFRTEIQENSSGGFRTVHYALLTGTTGLFRPLPLASGHDLTPDESRGTSAYLSSKRSDSTDQVGVIRDFGDDDAIEVRPLAAAFASFPVAGAYYIEAPTPAAQRAFLTRLASDATHLTGTAFTAHSFATPNGVMVSTGGNLAELLIPATYLLIVVLAILLAYRQLYEMKRIGVLRLHGHSVARTWFALHGRLIVTVLGISGGACVAGSLLIPGVTGAFVASLAIAIASSGAAMIAVSSLTCVYISRINLANGLKNRKDTRSLFLVNTGIKAVSTVMFVVIIASLGVEYAQAAHEKAELGNWDASKDYGVFIGSIGNDYGEYATYGGPPPSETAAEDDDLYPRLDTAGALYIDATEYDPVPPGTPENSGPKSLVVNPNYLAKYPIYTASGSAVRIPESTTNWIVLAPERDRKDAAQLQRYFQSQRPTPGQTALGRPVPKAVATQKVQIIWTKDGQNVFSFDPAVNPSHGNTIRDPIVQVMTLANSVGDDRWDAFNGDEGSEALKVPLDHGSTTATMHRLEPLLRTWKLNDNETGLITINDYVLQQAAFLDQGIQQILVVGAGLAAVLLALIVQGLTIAFERFARRVVVRSLFGWSFARRYREFLAVFAGVWVAQVLLALAANQAEASPFATVGTSTQSPVAAVFLTSLAAFAVEFLISAAVLLLIERRRTPTVLKSEF